MTNDSDNSTVATATPGHEAAAGTASEPRTAPGLGHRSDTERRRLERHIERLQVALDESEVERLRMLHSNSWRLTAPVRWLRRKLGAAQNGQGMAPAPVTRDTRGDDFPATFRAPPGRPDGPNDSYCPLDFDAALRPLLRCPDREGDVVEEKGSDAGHDHRRGEPSLRIAFLGSRELREELAFDAAVTPLRLEGWNEQILRVRHDFLLLETAWEPEGGWRYGLAGVGQAASAVLSLLRVAQAAGVPIVLWFREDPANYDRYAWLVEHADRVYAIDEALARRLSHDAPQARVGILPPAIQPALHNPIRSYRLREAASRLGDKVLYDGWWNLADGAGSRPILDALRERELLVVESEWDVSRIRLDDLPGYAPAFIGCMTPLEKAAVAKIAPVELVSDSALVPAWRRQLMMLRSAACGATVLHDGEHQSLLREQVLPLAAQGDAALATLRRILADPLARTRRAHLAFREILSEHCLADRLQRVVDDLDLAKPVVEAAPRVAVLLVTMRPERLAGCLDWFRRESYPERELIVVIHGDADLTALRRLLQPGEPVQLLPLGRERSLGDCLNFAIAHTDAPYWVKMDDDDHYGSNYLSDLMLYRRAVDAPLFGKPPMFLHLEEGGELYWDPVWAGHANLLHAAGEAKSALVAGGAFGGQRKVLETVRFSPHRRRGSDSEFIRRCYEHGHDLLSTDGFNFARFRSSRAGFHTWNVSSAELRARAISVGSSQQLESVISI